MKACVNFVEQGHIRVGCDVILDPAYLVTRSNNDYINWTDQSAIKQKVSKYNQNMDDFDFYC
ncbi:hypothetical protein A3Q56_08538 [Intoshia linei]|uniref:RNA-binding S4 domain-containing protein n=1 Tax=Intoshia linei TaxID=1819745 RepID=A0A177AQV1_9BILA|nr:hypothetical protein A3Q56_08538 [Intoshia linei]